VQATILIVDDQPLILDVLKKLLSPTYQVIVAQSAIEALDLLAKQSVDVVISDERMPQMPGSEFLSIVRERYPQTMRIILTGHASLESAIKAINQAQIFRFLTKPCNRDELLQTVKSALDHKTKGQFGEKKVTFLESLEKQAPGITFVKRDADGAILIDEEDL
jgi:DNA-binding NtrC family response regulator